ncbi:orotidine-5'-phosphate decarboxylase [Variovorax paradoxus]|uniref:orotidine-5'-phosphate decarboxylase n=1 Tax=Variovorax paradoxus TaxID=34073 RepID=UPI002781AA68|nr:orotidine-5'-phosphate decarboxylase [Variovorax paradoxus]MDQ0586475.1 orotidine-5'-phosphate decarboxylase [Variovorax paradoxus]
MDSRIIVSLDFATASSAAGLVRQLGPAATFYKVGLQLLTAAGPSVVRELVDGGKRVFLDLKLLEIPSSVAAAVTAVGQIGASMVTVHASGGSAVLRSAVEAARHFPRLKVLALTVITSMDDEDLREVGVGSTVREQVLRLARLAVAAGCHGVVASPLEARMLRETLPSDTLIVTPGIQLAGDSKKGDHARFTTAAQAIGAGATHVVVGRPISRASNPADAFAALRAELSAAR